MEHPNSSKDAALEWQEWHFEIVPPEQRLDCLYYEIGRESESFRHEVEAIKRAYTAIENKTMRPRRSHFTARLDFDDFYFRFRSVIRFFPRLPWLAIPEKLRIPFSSTEGLLCGNEVLFDNSAFWIIDEGAVIDTDMGPELDPGYLPIEAMINWNYSNPVIISQFKDWLDKESKRRAKELPAERFTKPGIIADQKGKGLRQTDTQLRQIAIMRLLHHMSFTQALAVVAARQSEIPHRPESESHWYRQKREAKLLIQRYLAFRSKTELPLSFESYSSYRKKAG